MSKLTNKIEAHDKTVYDVLNNKNILLIIFSGNITGKKDILNNLYLI